MEVNGVAILRTRIAFATWANTIQAAETRQAKLQQAVETWGELFDVYRGRSHDDGFLHNGGAEPASAATAGLSSIKAGLRYLPWSRNASPFENGAITFVTEENTAWNWTPGNRSQNSAVEFAIGPPGSGKSVAMNALAMGYLLRDNIEPPEIGPSPAIQST